MPIVNGIAVNFAYTGTNGITITGISGTLLQSADVSAEAEKEDVRDNSGDLAARSWYDQHLKATLEWIVKGTGLGNALTLTTLTGITPGVILVITACASVPDLVGTNWEVQSGAAIKSSNTTAKRISVPVEKRAGITAVASA
jgi:hypothetical protein